MSTNHRGAKRSTNGPTKSENIKRSKRSSGDNNDDRKHPAGSSTTTAMYMTDVMTIVMAHLSPKNLMNISYTCKALRETISTRIVIQSAMLFGGHAKNNMVTLVPLMEKKSIHLPSPLRLLRIANGKRCEICFDELVNLVRWKYGVFCCKRCMTARTKNFKVCSSKLRHILEHEQVTPPCFNDGKKRLWWSSEPRQWFVTHPFREHGTKAAAGPLICFDDVEKLDSRKRPCVETYIEEYYNYAEEEYKLFVEVVKDWKERAEEIKKQREEHERVASRRNAAKKTAKARQLLANLKQAMGDKPWLEAATSHTERGYIKREKGPLAFKAKVVEKILEKFIAAPSKMTKKVLKEIADDINKYFQMIEDKSFLSLAFLPDADTNDFEGRFKQAARAMFADYESLVQNSGDGLDGRFFALLQEDQKLVAAFHAFDNSCSIGDICALLNVDIDEEATDEDAEREYNLAAMVWCYVRFHHEGGIHLGADDAKLTRAFSESERMLNEARTNLQEYREWLEQRNNMNVQSCLERACEGREQSLRCLLKGDYGRLFSCSDYRRF